MAERAKPPSLVSTQGETAALGAGSLGLQLWASGAPWAWACDQEACPPLSSPVLPSGICLGSWKVENQVYRALAWKQDLFQASGLHCWEVGSQLCHFPSRDPLILEVPGWAGGRFRGIFISWDQAWVRNA